MIRSEDLLRVKKMILHPPHKRGIPFIAGCGHSPGKSTCSGFLPKTNPTGQSCSLYITLRHKDSTTPCNGHVQEHPKHIEAAVTLRRTPRLGRPNPARARRTGRGTLHRWLQPASSPGQVRHMQHFAGFVLQLHKPHATVMQPLQCVLQHHVACSALPHTDLHECSAM